MKKITTTVELVELVYETARELKISCGEINLEPDLQQVDQAIAEATRALRTLRTIRRRVAKK